MDTVANRYAVALLSIAREEEKVQEYIDEVEQILDVLEQNEGFLRILKDYGLTNEEKKETLLEDNQEKEEITIIEENTKTIEEKNENEQNNNSNNYKSNNNFKKKQKKHKN